MDATPWWHQEYNRDGEAGSARRVRLNSLAWMLLSTAGGVRLVTTDLLEKTLAPAVKDRQTTTRSNRSLEGPIEGVRFHESPTHVDDRGMLCEMFDPRWDWPTDPLAYAYFVTIDPGVAKGWALHKLHQDRYFLTKGELEVVLYDVRTDSRTYGEVAKIVLSASNRRLMSVPANVWHADHNVGTEEAVLANFPTLPYDHADPDKYRLPLDTPLIPHSFEGVAGW